MAFGAKNYARGGFASGGTVDVNVTPSSSPTLAANSSVPALGAPTAAQTAAGTDAAGNAVMAPPTPLSQPVYTPQPYANAIGTTPSLAALSGGVGAPSSIAAVSPQGIPAGAPSPPNSQAASSSLAPSSMVAPPAAAPATSAATPTAPPTFIGNSMVGNNIPGNNQIENRGGKIKPSKLAGGGIPTSEAMSPWYARQADREMTQMRPEGLLNSMGAGRTDIHPINVPAGSYIMPADVVSGLGEGNTMAGAGIVDRMMHSNPYGIEGGGRHGSSSVNMPRLNPLAKSPAPLSDSLSSLDQMAKRGGQIKRAEGGGTQQPKTGRGEPVPIIVAGGEFLIHPGTIIKKFGDLKKGHSVLDNFVVNARQKIAKTMLKLPGPKGASK